MKAKPTLKLIKKHKVPLLVAAGVAVAVVAVWVVARKTKGVDKKEKDEAEAFVGQAVTSGMNWKDMAVRLRKAFGGPNSSGTDEDEVYAVLGLLRNQADWEYLKRYWTQYCESLSWWQRLNDNLMNTSAYTSLTASLTYELDTRELQRCRDILSAKGITPDF